MENTNGAPQENFFPPVQGMTDMELRTSGLEMPSLVSAREEQEQKKETLMALNAVYLKDRGDEYQKVLDSHPELSYLHDEYAVLDPKEQDYLVGHEFSRVLANGDTYGLAQKTIDLMPEESRDQWRSELSRCMDAVDGVRLLGKMRRTLAENAFAQVQQKKAELRRGLEEFGNELGTALPEAVLQGKTLSPDMMEKATRYGQAERVTASLQRARAAVDLLRGLNRGGTSYGAHEGAVHAEAERIFKEENKDGTYYRFLGMEFGKPKTREEAEQQARANLGNSYEVTREFVSHLVNVLSDEDGQLDEGALGAMMLALDADTQGQQTIDTRFVRNMGEALKRWWLESDDFLRRYTKKDPFNEFLDVRNALTSGKPLTLEGYLTDKQQEEETHRRLYEDPRVEKLKSALSRIEDTRLSAADKAGFLTGSLTELGTITGDSAPAVLAGLASGGLSIAAFAPASMNRSIAQAHAEGRQNAELYGLITGGFEAVAEGSFGVAVRRVPFVGKLMDKAALGLIGKPVVGKAAAAVQSNWFLRYLGDRVVAESFGELVGEEVISQTGSYLTIQGLRGLGVNMDAPEWKPFSTAWENIQDERQSAATVAYCAALGLMGLSADTRAAREFSRSRENLMTVGLTPETATRLVAMTEDAMNQAALLQAGGDLNASKLRKLDDKLQTEYRNAYEAEVVNEDPVKLRDRLKKNHDLFMSDVEAQVSLKEGVLKVALREQGVLDVEESLTGKNVVTVEDTEQAEKDRASWKDGKMPEGYETPVKTVEWTDEQLAAYSQYAIGNEGLKRMKAIRSAALNLDMAAMVNEKDYARTLPLTESAAPVAAELSRSKGAITIDALRALSEAAAKEGEAGRNVLPGVSNAAVGAMEESFVKRLQWEARSGNTATASRLLAGEGGAAAIRLTAGEGPASRILYNPGHTLSTNLTEDVVESMLVDKMRKEGGMDSQGSLTDAGKEWLSAMHRDMQAVRRQVLAATGRDIMPGLDKAEPSLMNVAEYFSHLSQSAFYQQSGQYGLNDAAMRHVKFMDSALIQTKFLNDMGAGFAKWADTEAGRAWQKEGGTLAGLLRETGHELADLYTSSRVTAEHVAAVEEARRYRMANGTRTVEDIRAELEAAEQEAPTVTPESELAAQQPQEIPAEESVTGEAIPPEANEEVPDTDPESGQFIPPPGSVIETDPEGKGRGLEGGWYAEDGVEGSVIGMIPFSSLTFSEWPLSGFTAADGMAEVLRHTDGKMEVIMGSALLRQEQRAMKVRVWDADETHGEAWARGRALEQMVLSGLAPKAFTVRDYMEYYRLLYPAGLPNRSALGKLGKKAQQAVTILEKATPELVQDVLSGAVSAADAYTAVETAATQDGQRFYLEQKTTDKKASLEYLTALTRAYEAVPGADTKILQHQARYTVAARKDIRKAIARLRDVRGEKPRAVAQRELGIELPTAEAVADAITRLSLLDASFDAFESDLDIPVRAAEWDGKSPVRVAADFMQARDEVKQMSAAQKAAESLDKDAALLEQARQYQLPEPRKWMKPRAVPLTGAQAQEAIVKALLPIVNKDTTRLALNMVLHEVKDGREFYVATDGHRLVAISRIAPADAVEGMREPLGKEATSTTEEKYPEWRQVVPRRNAPGTRADLVDLARFSFLEDARSGKDEFGKPTFRTRDGLRIVLINHGKVTVLNPEYFSSLLKQVKKLNRELGMPTQAEVTCPARPHDPVRIDMGAGDWTLTSVIMPVQDPTDTLQPEDVVLNAYGEQADTREERQDQPTDEQRREASRPKTVETEEKAAPDKLEDDGRKMRARKDDYSRSLLNPLRAELPEDFNKVMVAKCLPKPNYEKLINEGVSQDVIIALSLIRGITPPKPRGWKARHYGKQWIGALEMYRDFSANLLEGKMTAHDLFASVAAAAPDKGYVELYRSLGYPLCLKASEFKLHRVKPRDARQPEYWRLSCVSDKSITSARLPADLRDRDFDSAQGAAEALASFLRFEEANGGPQEDGKKNSVKLDIRRYNVGPRRGECIITKELTGGVRVVLKDGFKSNTEAAAYIKEHEEELQEKLRRIARKPDMSHEVTSERVGMDYRNGENVDNAKFMEAFGVSGVTYGNWVAGPERQAKLNATYDAFMDLANLLGVPPRVISLNGELGIQFGASGHSKAKAHYRLDDTSINLTRLNGDGSLAHEWWHALDHYFQRVLGRSIEMSSDRVKVKGVEKDSEGNYVVQHETPGMNEQAGDVFGRLVKTIERSDYKERSRRMSSGGYWSSAIELTARAFQSYVVRKMKDANLFNEYLSSHMGKEMFDTMDMEYMDATGGKSRYPYPTEEEMQEFAPLFDKFFASLTHTKLDNGNYATFSVTAPEEDEGGTQMGTSAETTFSVRLEEPPKNTGIGYKVFYRGKDGKLYPPMVANPDGKDTPVGVWLDADEGVRAGVSKTGRPRVKAGGKGTQGGSGTLAYRPGWHLGEIPYALQFNRRNPQTGERDLFPAHFVWAEVEYAADHDYQEEAMSHGINPAGKFQHSLAGLPRIPKDGFYRYRTNPNPQTDPWIITGSMKVRRILSKAEVDDIVWKAGREPQKVTRDYSGTTFSVTALDDSGSVLTPEAFITRPDGNPDWFTIPRRKGQPAMPVRLLVGEDRGFHRGYGLTHIAASRDLDELWEKTTPERYISSILFNASELYLAGDREILVKGKRPASWMVLQLEKEHGYYSILTAYPVENPKKKPKGERIPLAERTPEKITSQVKGKPVTLPANPIAAPGAFGALQNKAASASSSAGGGDASSLPPGARIVNINDVRLRFDDGRQMQAGTPVSTMSLALMDDGLDSAPHLKERVVQQLIGDVRTAVRRFSRVFAGSTSTESAAREMGQAQALLGMINKYAAKGYRPRLAAQMRYVEVYARMLESGQILSYGKLSAQELESLKEDLETDLANAVHVSARGIAWEAAEGGLSGKRELEKLEKQARQEMRDTLVRDYADRKLDEVVRDMLNQGAAQLEKQLKDEEIARIGSLLDFIRPKKDPKTGKLKKGLMNADAYRRIARITGMMEAPAEEKAAKMEAINNRLAPHDKDDNAVTLEEAELDRLSLDLLDWSAYGALESMSLDAVRAAGESLRELVLVERNVWESRLEDEKKRLKKVAMDAVAVLGRADATEMRMMSEADLKARRLFGMMAENVMSFSQAMLAMSGMPGVMKELAQETLDAVSDGHITLAARERAVMDQLDEFKEKELGLTTERQKADFIERLKKTVKTGIVREKVKVHSLDLTVEEAQRWISMSKDERQAERDRLREEAERKGWAVENMVEEDDLLSLKDALNTALNPPPRIDGKKGRKRERVQVKREYMEKQKPLEASVDQLLNVILTYEQPFYAENARINGYTPEVLDALRQKVGADALAYGYKMRDLLSESGVAEEFERREGVPFPSQVNYWMSRFRDSSRINQNLDALDVERGTGTRYGMLIQRVDHKDEVDLSLGATNVFKVACAQQNNYLVMGRMTAKWRRLLANKEFSASLNQKLGNNRFVAIKQMIDLFDGAGVMEAVTQRAASSLTNMSQSAHAVSVLSFALTTIAKQPSALMHAAAFKSPVKVAKQIILDRMGHGKMTFSEMLKSPAFQARYRDNRVWVEMMNMKSDVKWTRMAALSRMGMDAIEKVDIWSNCVSMTALYNITWKELEANNRDAAAPMTEEQMKEICERAVKNALELVGQPQRLTQRSMMAALGQNNIWVKTSCYMGSEMLNKTGMAVAIGEMSRAQGESAIKRFGRRMLWLSTMSGMEQVILMLLDLMRGNGPDDEEAWMEWLVYNAVTGLSGVGLLNNLPIIGAPLEYFSGKLNKLLTGKDTSFVKTGLLGDMLFNVRGWFRCFDKLVDSGKLSNEERVLAIADAIRLGAAGSGITRGAYSTMQWTSTLSGILQSCSAAGNMVRPFIQRAINEEKQEKKERKERARRW